MNDKKGCAAVLMFFVGVGIAGIALSAFGAWGSATLWNYVAPVFNGPQVTFLQAWALLAVIGIIASAFRGAHAKIN